MSAETQSTARERYEQTSCEVCDVEGEPLTLCTFNEEVIGFTGDGRVADFDANQAFLVCAGCVEGHDEMEADDPDCPTLLAVGAS
jgi:hypothetical protein